MSAGEAEQEETTWYVPPPHAGHGVFFSRSDRFVSGDAPSAAPATQHTAAPERLNCRQVSVDLSGGAPSASCATQNQTEMLQVLRLPCKTDNDGEEMM